MLKPAQGRRPRNLDDRLGHERMVPPISDTQGSKTQWVGLVGFASGSADVDPGVHGARGLLQRQSA